METSAEPAQELRNADRRIEWVLQNPGMSSWLKDALRSAWDQNPVNLLNDLEILCLLLRARSQAVIDQALRH